MKGFILAAGFGKRMGDLTEKIPKPLLPVNGVPLIYYSLFQLFRWGLREAFVNLHYLEEKIREELRDFPHFKVTFSIEKEILGTAGGIRKILDLVTDEWLLVLNPDTILVPSDSMNPKHLANKLQVSGGDVLGLAPRTDDSVAALRMAQDGTLAFEEGSPFYYMGYSYVHRKSLTHLPPDVFAEMGAIWRSQAEQKELHGFEFEGKYLDAGTRAAYESLPNRIFSGMIAEEFEAFMDFRSNR